MPDPDLPLTERSNPRSHNLDMLPPEGVVALMIDEEARSITALREQAPAIANIARLAAESLRRGGRLLYVGAGTSGRLGVLDAVECVPTFRCDPGQVVGIIAGGTDALVRAVEGAEDDPSQGRAQIRALQVDDRDTLVGIAACGRTPFVLHALEEARARGAHTALVTAGTTAPPAELDEFVSLPAGPEVLCGSTRLKAGTATKITLNAISTTAMVMLGKVYGNLMVDVRPTNAKLHERATRLVAEIAGVDRDEAARTLRSCDWEVKTAALMCMRRLTCEDARARLSACSGFLGRALEPPRHHSSREQAACVVE